MSARESTTPKDKSQTTSKHQVGKSQRALELGFFGLGASLLFALCLL
jgi:hypothetical protein